MTTVNLVQPDITLFLDPDGVIQDLNLSDSIFDAGIAHAWRGQHWFDTVSNAEIDQVRRLVEDVLATGVSAARRITQRFPGGHEIPLEYTTVRLGADAGLVAIGRSYQVVADLQSDLIATRQSMEQEVWKLRAIETRYRLLFDTAINPVLVLDPETLNVTEANPTAMQALGIARGGDFVGRLASNEQAPLKEMLARAKQEGTTPGHFLHLGPARETWIVRASMDRDTSGAGILLQLTPSLPGRRNGADCEQTGFVQLVDRLPESFVVVDRAGMIQHTNPAFLDLIRMTNNENVVGQRLDRWLGKPGSDTKMLYSMVRRQGTVTQFPTAIQDEFGGQVEVAVSAGSDAQSIGIVIYDTRGRIASIDPARSDPGTVADILSDIQSKTWNLDGTSMLEAVESAVGIVEQHFIMSALIQVAGNKKAAAELLGVSRQNFYTKFKRYGLVRP